MNRAFDNPDHQRLLEQGHPYFMKLAELQDWTPDQLRKRLAHVWISYDNLSEESTNLRRNYEALVRQLEREGRNMSNELAKIAEARRRAGKAKSEAQGWPGLRELARTEWSAWQPSSGRKTRAAFYKKFEREHGAPADYSTMCKWLRGIN